jgi:hypothetical protein
MCLRARLRLHCNLRRDVGDARWARLAFELWHVSTKVFSCSELD